MVFRAHFKPPARWCTMWCCQSRCLSVIRRCFPSACRADHIYFTARTWEDVTNVDARTSTYYKGGTSPNPDSAGYVLSMWILTEKIKTILAKYTAGPAGLEVAVCLQVPAEKKAEGGGIPAAALVLHSQIGLFASLFRGHVTPPGCEKTGE